MATQQIKGLTGAAILYPYNAFSETTAQVSHDISPALANGDILEMLALPPGAKLTGLKVSSTNISEAVTISVGVMSGNYLDPDAGRTIEVSLGAGLTLNEMSDADIALINGVASSTTVRSIGVAFSGSVADGQVFLQASYVAE